MFGFLMGTLQKFKENEDEAKKSDKVHHLKKLPRWGLTMRAIMYLVQERRRAEIEEKLEQKRELEKEASMQARKDLFQELKSKKSKIARLAVQMSTIRAVLLSLFLLPSLYFVFILFSFSMRNGMLMTNYYWATSRPRPRLLSSICQLSTHQRLKLFLRRPDRPSKVNKYILYLLRALLYNNNIIIFL